ncbi:MAG: hypothetical protein JNN27_17395 [Planctomycetes bacterium]|nr:hypothetical protein [Planctomycetota bacterium]
MQEREFEALKLGEAVEVERGVVVERRSFLTVAASAFAAAGLPGLARAGRLDESADAFEYEDFLAEAVPAAKALVADNSRGGQDRYLFALAAIAVRLGDVPQPKMRSNSPGTYIGANEGGDPFVVLHWRLDPGARIGIHPHIYGNVVTLGLEGEVLVDNYEVEGERDWLTKQPFVVRRTVSQWLTRGGVNLVNLERNYCHGFTAGPNGARGLDITTRLLERVDSPSLVLGKPLEGPCARFEGTWKYD